MKLHYTTKDVSFPQYEMITFKLPRCGLTTQLINGTPCWCCVTDCQEDEIFLADNFSSLGFKTLNIDAVLDDLDRLTNNYKSKENKDEN